KDRRSEADAHSNLASRHFPGGYANADCDGKFEDAGGNGYDPAGERSSDMKRRLRVSGENGRCCFIWWHSPILHSRLRPGNLVCSSRHSLFARSTSAERVRRAELRFEGPTDPVKF